MRTVLLFLSSLLIGGAIYGQQVPQYSQYVRNQLMVNPAAAGVYDFVDITLGGRMQWLGFDDAPKTTYLYASSPLSKSSSVRYNPALRTSVGPVRNPEIVTGKIKHALGGWLLADQYGAFRQLNASLVYALHLPVSKSFNLSFGTSLGLSNRSFLSDKAQVLSVLTNTGVYDQTYADYTSTAGAQNTMDIGAGLYLYSKNAFFGLSAKQLSKDFVQFGNRDVNFAPGIHAYFTGGYKFPISNNLSLTPAVLVKYLNPSPVSFDVSLQLEYKEWLWCGASYRNEDAIVAMAGLNITNKFKLGYSYDVNISKVNNYSSGGHELVLGFMLGR